MGKAASGAELYFDVLRSMGPSTRLEVAIKEAEKVSRTTQRNQQQAARRAAKALRNHKAASKTSRKRA